MVEVCDIDNEPLVRMVGGAAVETVVSHDIIGRLMIQCARQPGLATVWEQLMGFDGGCSHDGLQGEIVFPTYLTAKLIHASDAFRFLRCKGASSHLGPWQCVWHQIYTFISKNKDQNQGLRILQQEVK